MAEQKWHFRLRLPWTSSTPGKDQSQPPNWATSRTSDQKPVFRPRASASPSASSRSAPPRTRPPRTESQPPSSSSSTTRSGAALPRASASRAVARPRAASQLPVPPRAATRPRAASQPPVPPRAATRPRAASQPPTPHHAATRPRATSQPPIPTREATATMPPSPPHVFHQAGDWVTTPQSPTPPLTESEAAASQPPTPTLVAKETQAADKPPSPPRVSPPQPQASPFLSISISETQPALQAAAQSQSPPKLASNLTEQTSSPQSPVASQPPISAAKEPQFTTRPPSSPPVSPVPQVTPSPSLTIYESQPALQDAAQSQSTSKLTSQPTDQTSPQSPIVSQPPTSAAKEPQTATRSPSPPPVSPKPRVTPPSSLTISETQPILQATAQSQSLPKLASHPAAETSSQPSSLSLSIQTKPEEEPKPPRPSVSNEEEQRPSRPQPELQDSRPEEERTMSPTKQRTFQASAMPTWPSETPLPAAVDAPEPDVRSEKFIPGKELNTSIVTEEPRPRAITELHAGPMHPNVPLDSEPNQMEKEAILNRMGGLDTSSSNIERIKGMMDDISTFVNKVAAQQQKLTVDEKAIGLITIAGENRGASMQLASDAARKGVPVPIKRRYKNDPDEISEATSDGEERPEYLENGDQPGRAFNFINSNTQSVNSSILLNRSIAEAKPGVPS